MSEHDDLPCSRCDVGIYAVRPVLNGLAMFGGLRSRKEALQRAPRCSHDRSHICFGARDFIVGCEWPLDAIAMAKIEGYLGFAPRETTPSKPEAA